MKIQLALDRLSEEECIRLVDAASDAVDWIEIGTGVIKEYGMAIVRDMKKHFPEKILVADMKTCDAGRYEAEQAFGNGADVMTVMAFAHDQTILDALQVARSYKKEIVIDLLQVTDAQRVQELHGLGATFFCLHVGKDSQLTGESASAGQLALVKDLSGIRLAIAGGIDEQSVRTLPKDQIDVAIVGSAITKSEAPAEAAKRIQRAIQQ